MRIIIVLLFLEASTAALAHITAAILDGSEQHKNTVRDGTLTWHSHINPNEGVEFWYLYEGDNLLGTVGIGSIGDSHIDGFAPASPGDSPQNSNAPNESDDGVDTSIPEGIPEPETISTEPVTKDLSKSKSPPDIQITHTRLIKKPYALLVYIRNESRRFLDDIKLQIVNPDGIAAAQFRLTKYRFLSPQGVPKRYTDYISPEGIIANNLVLIASNSIIENQKFLKKIKRNSRFNIGVQRFNSRNIYNDASKIRLLWQEIIVDEYPRMNNEPAAPRLHHKHKVATTWADVKQRHR